MTHLLWYLTLIMLLHNSMQCKETSNTDPFQDYVKIRIRSEADRFSDLFTGKQKRRLWNRYMNHWARQLVRLSVRNREYLVNDVKMYLTEYVDPSRLTSIKQAAINLALRHIKCFYTKYVFFSFVLSQCKVVY